MSRVVLLASSVFIAALALFLSGRTLWQSPAPSPVVGKNNTALFLINDLYGLTNVHMATAFALLEEHPQVQIHFASFKSTAPRLERISRRARQKNPDTHDIVFHPIDATPFLPALIASGLGGDLVHPAGVAGIESFSKAWQLFVLPWNGDDHLSIYNQVVDLFDEIDPAVVVLDTFFTPGVQATRDKNRLQAVVSPNTLVDTFIIDQPLGKILWKFPAMGSGFPYPVPWSKIPENVYLHLRIIYANTFLPYVKGTREFLRSKSIQPVSWLSIHRPGAVWISQALPEASVPVDVVPPNVTAAGPMSLSISTAAEQDAALAAWVARAPTVLINLGGVFTWPESHATAMAQAVAVILERTDVQVLWKFRKIAEGSYDDDFMEPLRKFLHNGRLKMDKWLAADPPSLLESGHIIASVHHGGAGSYHEALATGIPQVALPQWVDCYSMAQLVEDIGIGVRGCRETSPFWTPDCLQDAILKVIDGAEASLAMREKATLLGRIAQEKPGQYVAAREIVRLAGSGKA